MSEVADDPQGFAPNNPTDGREKGHWQTRYPPEAHRKIRFEAFYLALIFLTAPVLSILVFTDYIGLHPALKKYAYGWLGGEFGGVLFGMKWLYHSVARNIWNSDRRLWRLFTPHLSGGFAFTFVVLISSNILNIFSPEALARPSTVFGLGFLVGYFSDSAVGKLTEVANTIFGTEKSGRKSE